MNPRARVIAGLLFLSGFSALVYQMAWLREFRLIFGASTAASSAVLAIFVGGLGAGGLLLGGRADRHPQPLLLYARLEALIAASAALTPALLWLAREAYVASGGSLRLGLVGGTLLRLLLAALVLALPTWLMGGTLPAAARAAASAEDVGRRSVALLYGVNTLGAVAGAFLGTFFMLEVFGTHRTLWLACLVNLLVVVLARRLAQRQGPSPADEVRPPDEQEEAARVPSAFVLGAAAIVGFAFFLMELVWYRMLSPILGGSVFTFGLILSVALLGIGVGGGAYALLRRDRPATLAGFAATCLAEAAALVVPFALGDRLATVAIVLRALGNAGGFWGEVLGWTGVCLIVVFPAACVAGFQFPLLIGLLGRGRARVGRQVGLAYAWNTAGAIAGSLAGGFGLLPLLSAPGCWRLTTLLLSSLGLAALGLAWRQAGARSVVGPILLTAATLALLSAGGPTAAWRHSGIGVGRAPLPSSPSQLRNWMESQRRMILWEADGRESSVALETIGAGAAFVINGKVDGNARGDAPTMIMSALLGAWLHPGPQRALVIGLGTGGTAGWLAQVPGIERTDVYELEPLVLDVARDCAPINHRVLEQPKVRITVGDARELLLLSRESYDLIFSEPSNPYRAGVASLFTREYYQAAAQRLAADGLFVQWVQAYDVDNRTVQTLFATLHSVFPNIETWHVGRADLLLVASRRPVLHEAGQLRARLATEPFRSGFLYAWGTWDLEGALAWFVGAPGLARTVAESPGVLVNTDDRNLVEFGFARTVGKPGEMGIPQLRDAAFKLGQERLPVSGEVDWERVADHRMVRYRRTGDDWLLRASFGPSQRALESLYERLDQRDLTGALAAWTRLQREPRNYFELLALAEAQAELGREEALPLIERLGALQPTEGTALLGLLRLRQGRFEEARAALDRALSAYRVDPWPQPSVMARALDNLSELVSLQPGLAAWGLELVRQPFVLHGSEDQRLLAIGASLSAPGQASDCAAVLRPFEPHLPWTKPWLELRLACYVRARDAALARRAEQDLLQFRRQEPRPFAELVHR